MSGVTLRARTPPPEIASCSQMPSPKKAIGPFRASKWAITAKSWFPLPSVSWTMSRKVSLTSTVRPRTVWLPLIEAAIRTA